MPQGVLSLARMSSLCRGACIHVGKDAKETVQTVAERLTMLTL